ncbi:fatty acyl-AMP ligase [Amycolatopsis nigrescens]|uniref:fatty acyl-AMP ligase n=1 Tax=Amycolatopsis nigrescens TaxID=381445 RepID=UPI000374673F|nr:fatty acyl-AMP ligase [Amycolatopsis nigrescens]
MFTSSEKTGPWISPRISPAGLDRAGAHRETLPELLSGWATRRGDRTAVTYLDYSSNPSGIAHSLTWQELDTRVTEVAAWLQSMTDRGERAAILMGQCTEYIIGFLACLRAGLVAVPLFGPELPGHAERLAGVIGDAGPSLVLTTKDRLSTVRSFLDGIRPRVRQVVAVDEVPSGFPELLSAVEPSPDDEAYLQYTSGSTRVPTGVIITHRNVVASARQSARAYGVEPDRAVSVSWLPLYHDMGLVLAIAAPVLAGMSTVLMDPLAFLEKPVRWLRALSANPGAISAAPSFAYGVAAARVSTADKNFLRLDRVRALINGSEPVQAHVMDRFHEAFRSCGLKPETHRSSYGLAEATVLVSVSAAGAPPRRVAFDRVRLAGGRAVPAEDSLGGVSVLVSAGRPVGQQVAIVDPRSRVEQPAGYVGEIWVSGPNVGRGYWRRATSSGETFCAIMDGHGSGAEPNWWLRTGDLGVLFENELYVTGRIKDLIIVDGRNHYPQDIEVSAEQAHPAIRPHSAAAFAVPFTDGERLVVVAERSRWIDDEWLDVDEVIGALRGTISAQHGVGLHDVLLLSPGDLPRTTSGKVARSRCRANYLAGAFGRTGSR